MECPECGSEMIENGAYGYLAQHQSGEILGYTYTCPNSQGFENIKDAEKYKSEKNIDCEVSDIVCESEAHNGYFYTNKSGDLLTGYPC